MTPNTNILEFSFIFLPVLFYSLIIYFSAPKGLIRIKTASFYFIMGLLSTYFIYSFVFTFPFWYKDASPDRLINLLILCFIQIGLFEESTKLIMYGIGNIYYKEKKNTVSIMYYMMSVACGFAVAENYLYVDRYGSYVLFYRSFSAVIVHMVCGLITGYFMAIGFVKGKILKRIGYTIIGVTCAAMFHGLYDIAAMTTNDSVLLFIITGFGLILAYVFSGRFFGYFNK